MTGRADLKRDLGEDLEVLALLSDEESAELATLLREARRNQQQALDASLDEALGHLPRLIRGTARKILFG